jgi:hypothetical protein
MPLRQLELKTANFARNLASLCRPLSKPEGCTLKSARFPSVYPWPVFFPHVQVRRAKPLTR